LKKLVPLLEKNLFLEKIIKLWFSFHYCKQAFGHIVFVTKNRTH